MVEITQVEYRRLVSTGDYSNQSIGATARVGDGQTAEETMVALRSWVDGQLTAGIQARATLDRLNREVEAAKERAEKGRAWCERANVPLPKGWDDDMPF